MTEIMWFLSILILTGALFQKGQEWRSETFSRACFITRLENMKQFSPLACPWLRRWGRRSELGRRQGYRAVRLCLSSVCRRGRRPGWAGASRGRRHPPCTAFLLSPIWGTFPCTLELFVNHHTFVAWSSDFLGGTVLIIRHSIFIELPSSVIKKNS